MSQTRHRKNPFTIFSFYVYGLYFVLLMNKLIFWPQEHAISGEHIILGSLKKLKAENYN